MATLPQLVKATPQGGTIHKYQLSGGKTSFMRYLDFCLSRGLGDVYKRQATEFVSSIELSPKSL